MVTLFGAPRTYTGEDVVEVAIYGSPVLEEGLLKRLGEVGVLPALPGEFTFRAVQNGKMDLAQAEGIGVLLEARTSEQAERALESAEGALSGRLARLKGELTGALALLQAAVEFPDEELEAGDARIGEALRGVEEEARRLAAACVPLERGGLLVVALAGPPNAGKSTLFNRLAGSDRALVTPVPGTTRDGLREEVRIGGRLVALEDTAGLFDSDDPVTLRAVERAEAALDSARRVLWLADATRPRRGQVPGPLAERLGDRLAVAANKADLGVHPDWTGGSDPVFSCLTGEGLEAVEGLLAGWAEEAARATREAAFLVTWRQQRALTDLARRLQEAVGRLEEGALELAAQEVLDGAAVLADLTGEIRTEAVLDLIFSRFGIGK